MAKIYGELEVAQLEGFTTVNLPAAAGNFRRVVYDLTTGQVKVSDNTNWIAQTKVSNYDYSIGTVAGSDYSTILAALTAHPNNTSFLLHSSYVAVENVSITGDNITIIGMGVTSAITGTLTLGAASDTCKISNLKVTGNITLTAGGTNHILSDMWLANAASFSDSSTGSQHTINQL